MNRRRFLELLGRATVGGAVAYSFPNIIVPKNIEVINGITWTTKREIFPQVIEDFWFQESPFMSHMRKLSMRIIDDSEYGFGYVEENGVWHHEVVSTEECKENELYMAEKVEPVFFVNSEEIKMVKQEEKPLLKRIFGIAN